MYSHELAGFGTMSLAQRTTALLEAIAATHAWHDEHNRACWRPGQRKERSMTGIVCAVRGGPDSQPTIARAIALAQETGLPLYFLYVVNLDFLVRTSSTRTHTISEQMHQMGEFILLAAQASASEQGVSAEGIVRHGDVVEEIVDLCRELDADYVVLGHPRLEREESVFSQELLQHFIEQAEQQTGAKVIMAGGGEG